MRSEDFDHDTEGELIWVAERGGRPLGFVSAWAAESFVHNLFVHPNATGTGVGSALLDACLAHLGRPATLKVLEPQYPCNALLYPSRTGFPGNCTPSSSRGGVAIPCNRAAITRHRAWPRNEYDTHFLVKTCPRRVYLMRGWHVVMEDEGPDGKYLLMRLGGDGTSPRFGTKPNR